MLGLPSINHRTYAHSHSVQSSSNYAMFSTSFRGIVQRVGFSLSRGMLVRAASGKPQPRVNAVGTKTKKSELSADLVAENKAKALETTIKEVNQKFGKGSLMVLGNTEQHRVDTIPSGSLTLDIALGGGFPKGRIIEVYGPESSGKTTLALHAMAAVQQQGGTVALIDAEHAFDEVYARKTGINTDKLLLCQPDCGEMGLEVVDQLIRSSAVDIIVIDSVAALTPRAEIEGEIGMITVGAQARLMSSALRKLCSSSAKCQCTIIFLNQLRHKVGVLFGSPEVTTGGQALKYFSSVRVDVRRKATIKAAKADVESGIRVRAKVVKNKCAAPYRLAEFDILFNNGICTVGCVLDAAEHLGIVTRRGAYYYFGEQRVGQGRDNAVKALKENQELCRQIEAESRGVMSSANTNDWYADKSSVDEEDDSADDDLSDDEPAENAALA